MILDLLKLILRKHKDYWVLVKQGFFSCSPDLDLLNELGVTAPPVGQKLNKGWKSSSAR